jgi:hypothetical protein
MLVAVAMVSLAACQGGGGETASTGTSTTAPATTAPATTAPADATVPGTCPGFRGASTALASVGATAAAVLVGADAGAAGCLDQVTFTFRSLGNGNGLPPGYVVQYKDPAQEPFLDGDPPVAISLPGAAFLVVTMSPALSVDPFVEGMPSTYDGNLSLEYGEHSHLQIVRKLPDGQNTVVWVIGLDSVRPFRVDRAEDPPRVTVYIG